MRSSSKKDICGSNQLDFPRLRTANIVQISLKNFFLYLGPVIIGGKDFRRGSLDFWENTRGGVSSKGEAIAENLEGLKGGTTYIFLQNEDMGDHESHQKLLGGITSVK